MDVELHAFKACGEFASDILLAQRTRDARASANTHAGISRSGKPLHVVAGFPERKVRTG
jgi:hypothetical protein